MNPSIGLLIIATNRYKQFISGLLTSAQEHFMPGFPVSYHIFTDVDSVGLQPHNIHLIEPYRFPYATLYRYKIFVNHRDKLTQDYLFYIDVDSLFVDKVGDEILHNGLTAVYHPGFYAKGGGSWETRKESTAYLAPERKRLCYVAGGFQGGRRDIYLKACEEMSNNINIDEQRGVISCWHDESHWNRYFNYYEGIKYTLSPAYMMVEQLHLRKAWRIDGFEPKILALAKKHEEIRK